MSQKRARCEAGDEQDAHAGQECEQRPLGGVGVAAELVGQVRDELSPQLLARSDVGLDGR